MNIVEMAGMIPNGLGSTTSSTNSAPSNGLGSATTSTNSTPSTSYTPPPHSTSTASAPPTPTSKFSKSKDPTPSTSASTNDDFNVDDFVGNLPDELLCKVCRVNRVKYMLQDCKHLCLCEICIKMFEIEQDEEVYELNDYGDINSNDDDEGEDESRDDDFDIHRELEVDDSDDFPRIHKKCPLCRQSIKLAPIMVFV